MFLDDKKGGEVRHLNVLRESTTPPASRCNHRRKGAWCALALAVWAVSPLASAQTCGFLGERNVKSYWLEGSVGMVVVPTEPFANPSSCTRSDQMFVLSNNPQYKNAVAAVIHSMASGVPIQVYACGCHAYWSNQTWPIAGALGVGGAPK